MPAHLAHSLQEAGISLPDCAIDRLARYRDLIAEHGARFNITAVREPEAIERRHILESLALAKELDSLGLLSAAGRVIDIGSGAGLPGIPLKVAFPALSLTLLEAAGKKCRFLSLVVEELALDEVEVVEGRAEEVAHRTGRRAAYDLALARAVAPLAVLLEYALPFLKPGGHFAGAKGSAAPRELAEARGALQALGGELLQARPFRPPGGLAQTLIVVRQVSQSPEAYPRRPGIPGKRPLA